MELLGVCLVFVVLIWLPASWTFLRLCRALPVHLRPQPKQVAISGRLQIHGSATVIREAEWEHTERNGLPNRPKSGLPASSEARSLTDDEVAEMYGPPSDCKGKVSG